MRAELQRVVEQVGDRALEQGDPAAHHRARLGLERDLAPAAAALAGHDPFGQLGQIDVLLHFFVVGVRRELHQLADEIRELAQLDTGRSEQLLTLVRAVRLGPLQELDVGAQRRQRSTELVARVHHEAALLLA